VRKVTIANVPIDALKEAPENPNVMEPERYGLLVEAIRKEGFLQPVLAYPLGTPGEYRIVDGHHRVKAAREVGMVEVPAVIVADVEEAHAIAIRIGMNRLRGELDLTSVGRALKDLVGQGWQVEDLTITGFNVGEVTDLLASVSQSVDAALPKDMEAPPADYDVEDSGDTKPYVLEIEFTSREEYQRAKKGLKRAAGKGNPLSDGLLRLLGGGAEEP